MLTGAAPARFRAGESFVIIEGSNFARGAQAQLGGQPVTQLTWVNPSVLTGFTPAGMAPGSYDLSVTNPNGASATLRGGVAILAAGGATASPVVAPSAAPSVRIAPPTTAPTPRPTAPPASPPAAATRTVQPSVPSPAATRPPQRPAITATPAAATAGQPAVDLSGSWQITDGVNYGPGSGQSFTFTVALRQQGGAFSGTGDGLSINGTVSGLTLHAEYRQDNGTGGSFDWTLAADGASFAGSFTNSSGNGGTSSGRRLAATFAAAPNEKPPAAAPKEGASGRGGSKKKER